MNRLRELAARVRGVLPSRRLDDEFDAEMRSHLEILAEEHERRGLSPDDARLAARRDFGGVARARERHREQRGLPFFDTLVQDVTYALQLWRRAPGFAIVVIVVLALGIGANSAMFTLVNMLLFRPLPGRAAELRGLYSHDPSLPDSYRPFSYPNYADIRDHNDVFDGALAHTFAMVGLPQGDSMRRTFVEMVSSNYFTVLGVPLVVGRAFTADEERPGADRAVAVASYASWQATGSIRRFPAARSGSTRATSPSSASRRRDSPARPRSDDRPVSTSNRSHPITSAIKSAGRGTDRQAHAELSRLQADDVRDHAVDPDGRQQQRKQGEDRHHRHGTGVGQQRLVDQPPTRSSSSTPATKATTRWAECCGRASEGSGRRGEEDHR